MNNISRIFHRRIFGGCRQSSFLAQQHFKYHHKSHHSYFFLWFLAPITTAAISGLTFSSLNKNNFPLSTNSIYNPFSFQTVSANNDKNNKYENRRKNRGRQRKLFGNKLCSSVRSQDYDLVRQLLQSSDFNDPNTKSEYGFAPIHIASVNDDIKMVKILLEEFNADPNVIDLCNPYMGDKRRILFSDKIHANAPTQGWTPLHYAVAFMNEPMIKLLMQNGATPNIKDSRGFTCTDYLDDERIPNAAAMLDTIDMEYENYIELQVERERIRRLQYPIEDRLKEKIVGQLLPISSVASAVRRKLNGWHNPEHPLVFLFLGSSGVGKTELAKTLATVLHNQRIGFDYNSDTGHKTDIGNISSLKSFIRMDMSEYQHKHEVAKFIGSPPGYVGHDEGGQLTSRLKECPNAIVLLDEVEKAHPDVLTIMLQLFDEGRITDGKGETVECKDAIFVMTSNLAQTEIGDEAENLRRRDAQNVDEIEQYSLSQQFIEDVIQPILKKHFQRDEFLGRINEILYFLPFSEMELKELTVRELEKWNEIALNRHNIKLEWDECVIDLLRDGYNFRYGARSIQHEVEKRVVNQLAKFHELGNIQNGSTVKITADEGGMKLECIGKHHNSSGSGKRKKTNKKTEVEPKKSWLW